MSPCPAGPDYIPLPHIDELSPPPADFWAKFMALSRAEMGADKRDAFTSDIKMLSAPVTRTAYTASPRGKLELPKPVLIRDDEQVIAIVKHAYDCVLTRFHTIHIPKGTPVIETGELQPGEWRISNPEFGVRALYVGRSR